VHGVVVLEHVVVELSEDLDLATALLHPIVVYHVLVMLLKIDLVIHRVAEFLSMATGDHGTGTVTAVEHVVVELNSELVCVTTLLQGMEDDLVQENQLKAELVEQTDVQLTATGDDSDDSVRAHERVVVVHKCEHVCVTTLLL